MFERLKGFAHRNPVRVTAWISASVALLLTVLAPDLPVEPVVIFVLSSLGLGEYAQRVEDKKTVEALYLDTVDEDEV
jgi:hypothetical protein